MYVPIYDSLLLFLILAVPLINFIFTVLEAEKFKIKLSNHLAPGEASLPGLLPSHCVLT